MNDTQKYLVEEELEHYRDGWISRRDFLHRASLLGIASAAAAAMARSVTPAAAAPASTQGTSSFHVPRSRVSVGGADPEAVSLTLPDGLAVDGLWTEPAERGWVVAYAPGAGSNLHDPFGRYLSNFLAEAGIGCLRFQFPYMQGSKRFPDRMPVLEDTWRAALSSARERGGRCAATGRSMGGRVASLVAADGAPMDALVCFAYPLHRPGRPDQRRDEHLARIPVPMLVCSGTRDTFGTPDELRDALRSVPKADLCLLDGADHGYNVLKASGRTRADIWHEAAEATVQFLYSVA